jgi:hypothetical protein
MKGIKLTFIVVLAALVTFGLAGMAQAFHAGGVAHCDGCHAIHAGYGNEYFTRNIAQTPGTGHSQLLIGQDPTSTCLNCHIGSGGYHVYSTDGSNTNEGGDFYWVENAYTVTVRGTPTSFAGYRAGHDVVAADFGMAADPVLTGAPGGTFPSGSLGCNSCHDPHGQTANNANAAPISVSGSYGAADPTDGSMHGNYRLLGGVAYQPPGAAGGFANAAPIARANSSNGAKVAYGSGMSEWCRNCHSGLNAGNMHPADDDAHLSLTSGDEGANYNLYLATGNLTGTSADSYDPLVPIEFGETDGSLLFDVSAGTLDRNAGATANSNVMCLTCHRAHASSVNNAGRWDFQVELLEESHPLTADAGQVPATAVPFYVDGASVDLVSRYGQWQRSLCNKCHIQD